MTSNLERDVNLGITLLIAWVLSIEIPGIEPTSANPWIAAYILRQCRNKRIKYHTAQRNCH
jgi:hypothetical protein